MKNRKHIKLKVILKILFREMIASYRVSELQLLLGKRFLLHFVRKNFSNSDRVKSSTFLDLLSKFLKVAAVISLHFFANSNGGKLSMKMGRYSFLQWKLKFKKTTIWKIKAEKHLNFFEVTGMYRSFCQIFNRESLKK